MDYFFSLVFIFLLVLDLFIGIYNWVYTKEIQLMKRKFGIDIPSRLNRLFKSNAIVSFLIIALFLLIYLLFY